MSSVDEIGAQIAERMNAGPEAAQPEAPQETEEVEPIESEAEPVESEEQEPAEDAGEDLEDDAGEQETEGGEPFTSVEELAEAMEASIEDMKALKISFKSNGKDVSPTLEELVRTHQQSEGYEGKIEHVKERELKAEESYQRSVTDRQKSEAINHQVMQASMQHLIQEFQSPEVQALAKSQDPDDRTAFLIKQNEANDKFNQLNSVQQKAAAAYDKYRSDLFAYGNKQLSEKLEGFNEKGSDHKEKMVSTLQSLGLTTEEISNMPDYRVMLGAYELAQAREKIAVYEAREAEQKNTVKNKVKAIPKFNRSTGKKPGVKRDALEGVRNRFHGSSKSGGGTVEDAAALIAERYANSRN